MGLWDHERQYCSAVTNLSFRLRDTWVEGWLSRYLRGDP